MAEFTFYYRNNFALFLTGNLKAFNNNFHWVSGPVERDRALEIFELS
jgi:hypothetical protein